MSRKLAIDENIGIIHSCLRIGCSRHPTRPFKGLASWTLCVRQQQLLHGLQRSGVHEGHRCGLEELREI